MDDFTETCSLAGDVDLRIMDLPNGRFPISIDILGPTDIIFINTSQAKRIADELYKLADKYSLDEKIKAQKEYCRSVKTPRFAPNNGICWSCHKQIYNRITLEMAGSRAITGCPHCHYSFCE